MSYDTSQETITVNDIEYTVDVAEVASGRDYTIQDPWVGGNAFEGLEGHMGFDQDVESPRSWDNVGTMSVKYDRYSLGDEDISHIDFSLDCPDCDGDGFITVNEENEEVGDCPRCEGTGVIYPDPVTYFKQERKARVVLPLCVYEHSGMTMYVGARGDYPFDQQGWDTSFVGFIFDTPEGIKDCMGNSDNVSDEEIEKALEGEVKVYASYLEGDVSYFHTYDEETDYGDGCGGFIGDFAECENQLYASLEQAIQIRLNEYKERDHWAARDVETV